MEFRVLGPTEVWFDGRPVDVGHPRQRCVLAVLLVEANQTVSVDLLVDRVWGDRRAQRAREVVHSYVSRLRRALAGTDFPGITRASGGYRLTVDAMAVDLHRFRHLVTRARAVGEPDAAAVLLAEALGLWHGEPFGDVDTPWINAVRDTMAAERLAARLDHNDILLGRGDHDLVLGPLSAAAGANPLDERVTGQLMHALYLAGRQAEALECYQRLRGRLAEDLGAHPSPPLRRLHGRILSGDPALAPTPPPNRAALGGPVRGRTVAPRHLPAPPLTFTGRTRELAELTGVVDASPDAAGAVVISAIGGAGGVGKTWLALRWAHDNLHRFPDGQIYVDLRGFSPGVQPLPPAVALRGFLEAMGVDRGSIPAEADAQAALYRSLVADRRLLIVLDNARDSAQVTPLLPGSGTCTVLVTSRHHLPGLVTAHGARRVVLDVLTEPEARQVLTRHLGVDRVAADPEAVTEVLGYCGGLPLAVGIAAARVASDRDLPLRTLAAELREASLDALDAGELAANLRAVLSCSYETLSASAARMFGLVAVAPGPDVGVRAAASLAGVAPARARQTLRELTDVHLTQQHRPGRYRMHDLVRRYAGETTEHTDGEADRMAGRRRVLDHYLHAGHAAALLLDPYREPLALPAVAAGVTAEEPTDHDRAMAWFAAEHAVLVAAVDEAAVWGLDVHGWQLASSLAAYFDRRGLWDDQAGTHTAGLVAARRLADPAGQAHMHRGLGRAHARLGRERDAHAHYERALALFAELDDQIGTARTHVMLSWLLHRQGRNRDALDQADHAHDLYRLAGNPVGEASALSVLGWYRAQLGELRPAVLACERALALHRELGNVLGLAGTLDSLGYAHGRLGDHAAAATHYRHALRLFEQLGSPSGQVDALTGLGDALDASGEPEPARDAWRRALTIVTALGTREAGQLRERLGTPP